MKRFVLFACFAGLVPQKAFAQNPELTPDDVCKSPYFKDQYACDRYLSYKHLVNEKITEISKDPFGYVFMTSSLVLVRKEVSFRAWDFEIKTTGSNLRVFYSRGLP